MNTMLSDILIGAFPAKGPQGQINFKTHNLKSENDLQKSLQLMAVRKQETMPSLVTLFNNTLEVLANAIRQKKEIKIYLSGRDK